MLPPPPTSPKEFNKDVTQREWDDPGGRKQSQQNNSTVDGQRYTQRAAACRLHDPRELGKETREGLEAGWGRDLEM